MKKSERPYVPTEFHTIAPGAILGFREGGQMRLEDAGMRDSMFHGRIQTYFALLVLPSKKRKPKPLKPAAYQRWAEKVSELFDDEDLEAFVDMLDGDARDQFFHFIARQNRRRRNPRT